MKKTITFILVLAAVATSAFAEGGAGGFNSMDREMNKRDWERQQQAWIDAQAKKQAAAEKPAAVEQPAVVEPVQRRECGCK